MNVNGATCSAYICHAEHMHRKKFALPYLGCSEICHILLLFHYWHSTSRWVDELARDPAGVGGAAKPRFRRRNTRVERTGDNKFTIVTDGAPTSARGGVDGAGADDAGAGGSGGSGLQRATTPGSGDEAVESDNLHLVARGGGIISGNGGDVDSDQEQEELAKRKRDLAQAH